MVHARRRARAGARREPRVRLVRHGPDPRRAPTTTARWRPPRWTRTTSTAARATCVARRRARGRGRRAPERRTTGPWRFVYTVGEPTHALARVAHEHDAWMIARGESSRGPRWVDEPPGRRLDRWTPRAHAADSRHDRPAAPEGEPVTRPPHHDPRLIAVVALGGMVGTTARWALTSRGRDVGERVPDGDPDRERRSARSCSARSWRALLRRGAESPRGRVLRLGAGHRRARRVHHVQQPGHRAASGCSRPAR